MFSPIISAYASDVVHCDYGSAVLGEVTCDDGKKYRLQDTNSSCIKKYAQYKISDNDDQSEIKNDVVCGNCTRYVIATDLKGIYSAGQSKYIRNYFSARILRRILAKKSARILRGKPIIWQILCVFP